MARVKSHIFYKIYFLCIILYCVALFIGLRRLNSWLRTYEASQPTVKSQEVFDELFGDPDWAALYAMAGLEDTPYEGADEYATYMEQRVAGRTLTYTETSAGTSGDKKYYVRLGDERIASFTLTGQTESYTNIPDWRLGTVELFPARTGHYQIEKQDGHVAYINGIPLDEDCTIRITTTDAADYLPDGTAGAVTRTQEIDGLLITPTVTVKDQDGNAVELTYDEASGTFSEGSGSDAIPDELQERATATIKALAKFLNTPNASNTAESRAALATYFDRSGTAYEECMRLDDDWINAGVSQDYQDIELTEYIRYSDEIFSVRVTMDYAVTMSGGKVKTYPMDYTFFYQDQDSKWMVYDMSMGTVQTVSTQVRLTFMDGDTELSTGFYDTDISELTAPVITVPEGKTLSWVRKSTDESGREQLTIVFTPDQATGTVRLGTADELEPMTLYAYLDDTSSND